MLFAVDTASQVMTQHHSTWEPRELEFEAYLVPSGPDDDEILHPSVFGEPLLVVDRQVQTKLRKRADILALDQAGNGVIVELKRDQGRLGVDTQTLQYLADFSQYKGQAFIQRFTDGSEKARDGILGFVGGEADLTDLNKAMRVILLARHFDESLFSMQGS